MNDSSARLLRAKVLATLREREEFPKEWAVAKVLATLTPRCLKMEILDSWDYLVSLDVDIPLVLATAKLIRSAATDEAEISERVEELLTRAERIAERRIA